MKIITMYELLGLVKDGKAPKKIKYKDETYYLCDSNETYIGTISHSAIGRRHCLEQCLTDEVEILEEEKKIPETLIPTSLKGIDNLDEKIAIAHTDTICVIDTVNEIIDYLGYLKSKGDNNE